MADFQPFACGAEGESGVTLTTLREHTQHLDADAPLRRYLPSTQPIPMNTIRQLERELTPLFKPRSARLEGGHDVDGTYHVRIHVSGEDEKGVSLSAERVTCEVTFHPHDHPNNAGGIDQLTLTGGSEQSHQHIRDAWHNAQERINSRSWSEGWTQLHRRERGSVYLTTMSYYVWDEEQGVRVEEWISIATACGLRALRYDQPALCLEQTLTEMVQAQLDVAEARLQAGTRTTEAHATRQLEGVADLAQTLSSLRSVLGSATDRVEQSVKRLKGLWDSLSDTGAPAQRKRKPKTEPKPKSERVRLSEAGRACHRALRDVREREECVTISEQGRIVLPQLVALRAQADEEQQALIAQLELIAHHPQPFSALGRDALVSLIEQGFVQQDTIPARALWEALDELIEEPPLTDVDMEEYLPTLYVLTERVTR